MHSLHIDERDTVRIALRDLAAGTPIRHGARTIVLPETIPAKHKLLLHDQPAGSPVVMYGVVVGLLTVGLRAGQRLTTERIANATDTYGPWDGPPPAWPAPDVTRWRQRTFRGYHRADGRVGTANHWLVFPLVFCENRNVERLRELLLDPLGYGPGGGGAQGLGEMISAAARGDRQTVLSTTLHLPTATTTTGRVFPNVDGLRFLTHEAGCGGTRQDARSLCRLLAGYVDNPNVAGATVLSLGCQNAEVEYFRSLLRGDKPVYIIDHQYSGGQEDYLTAAVRHTLLGLGEANRAERQPAPPSRLTLGLECGGSDGFSGISANPVLGRVSDMLVALGGSAILAEFPELAGVEGELIARCRHREDAERFARLMQTYGAAAEAVGSGFKDNPSPGNIRDGLVTDAMKSAGAARKGGSSPITGVLEYGFTPSPAAPPGLRLLCTPGNDVESTTALAGAGANLIVFTTGLGTPTGNPVAPVVKVSSNSALAERMPDLIDFDAGTVVRGKQSVAAAADQLLELLLRVASGETVPWAEHNQQYDFIPWKQGISL